MAEPGPASPRRPFGVTPDTSGVEASKQLHRALECRGVRLVLCALNEQPLALVRQRQFDALLGDADLWPDLQSALGALRATAPATPVPVSATA